MRKNFMSERTQSIRLFKQGFGYKAAARFLGIPHQTMQKWYSTYRALGEEALMTRGYKTYDLDLKIQVVRTVIEEGLTKAEAMKTYGIKSISQIDDWCKKYRDGGIDALKPKPKGRPKKQPKVYTSREEELEARIEELELELEIQKRINALADELNQR